MLSLEAEQSIEAKESLKRCIYQDRFCVVVGRTGYESGDESGSPQEESFF